jgi:hypothetical protein
MPDSPRLPWRYLLASGAWLVSAMPGVASAQAGSEACAAMATATQQSYRNDRFGLAMTYPSDFVLDPASIPANGESARFWTADHRATAVVIGTRNGSGQSIQALMQEARRNILENGDSSITYTRQRDNWFVLSGFLDANRIFYQRTLLARETGVVGTLWIEFPRALKPCFEAPVTLMSLSFRAVRPNVMTSRLP